MDRHVVLAAPLEVLEDEVLHPVAAGPADVLGHELVGQRERPPGVDQAAAELGLLAVEPDALVEPADRLERLAPDEEAGADDEAVGVATRRRQDAMEAESLTPRSRRRRERPAHPLLAAVRRGAASATRRPGRDLRQAVAQRPNQVARRHRRPG